MMVAIVRCLCMLIIHGTCCCCCCCSEEDGGVGKTWVGGAEEVEDEDVDMERVKDKEGDDVGSEYEGDGKPSVVAGAVARGSMVVATAAVASR